MSRSTPTGKNVPGTTESHRSSGRPRHTREDALTDLEFEQLLRSVRDLDYYFALDAEFILLVAGRLGLRRGEIAHMEADWINWRKQRIEIPSYEACRSGREGDVCGHCRQLATQQAEHNDDVALEDALAERWSPKTQAAIRAVPFGFCPRAEIILREYFDVFDRFPRSPQVINRRIKRVADECETVDRETIYPHALRATAASFHAGRGMQMLPLQALMGWADPSTARKYIATSPENTARELQMTHSR